MMASLELALAPWVRHVNSAVEARYPPGVLSTTPIPGSVHESSIFVEKPSNRFAGIFATSASHAGHTLSSQPSNALRDEVCRASSICNARSTSAACFAQRSSHFLRVVSAMSNIFLYAGSLAWSALTSVACAASLSLSA